MDCQPSTICLRTAGPFRAALWVPVAWATVSLGLTLSSAFSTEGAAAEVDASREAPWGAASLVRWESLRNGPQCVRGPLPQWDAKHQTHVLTLAPGDAVLFRLPTGSQVRVKAHDGAAQPHEFTATVSNGSGMHKTVPRIDGHGDGEWMFASNEPQHSLCRITLDGAAPCSRRVEIYVSSRDPLRTAEGYATLLPLEGTAIRVTEGTRTRRFWEIAPGEPAGYSVTGPARLRIQSRFVYDIYDRTSRQEYSLYTRCAGELLRVHEGHTTAATRSRLRCSDRPRALGQLETHFLNVGPGTHQLTCDPSARVLLRIEAEDAGAFAADRLNHRITRRDSVDGDFPERSLWDIADGTCAPDVAAPWDSIGLAQQLSMRIARDNRYAQGGLRAAMAIQAVAARNRQEATLQTFARRLLATSTYYRSLIPSDPVTQQRILPAAFLLPRIREPDEDPLEIAMTASWAADLGRQLGQGEFVRAMGNREQPLEYVLPPREGATLLRLAVDRESLSEATRIWLQLGDELQPVDVSPCPELEPNAFVATNATAAWSWRLLNGGAADLPHEAWAEDDAPRPLINAAYAELYVPSHVRTVRLWRESPHGVPPYVAVQVRVHRRFQLNERQYVDALRRACPSPSELWACLLQGAPPPSEGEAAIATERLRNHWEPLRQALEASRAALEATVQPRQRRPRYSGDAEALARSATEAFQRGDWVTAVEAWSPLEPHVDLPNHAEGMLQRAEALRQLDEGGLAETELRGWALHGSTPPLRHRAAERLLEWYEQEGDWEQQERLLAYLVLEHPRPDRLAHLCRVWAHQGKWDRVLSVGLTLDDADRPHAALRPAAFHEGWWRTFDDTQRADHDLVVVDAWRRRRDKAWGQTTTDTSFAVPSRDEPALPPSDSVITRQWAEHSGWVAGYGQAVSLSMPSRDWHPRHYVAGPGKPLQLQVPGPIALKLEVRPLHPPPTGTTRGEDAPVETLRDDVLTMTHNGRRGRRVLIRNNRQNPHWKVVGHAELGVGNAISTEIHLGAGWHTLAFEPADGVCACRVESRMVSEPPVAMRGWLKKGQEEVPQTPGTQAWRHGRVLRSRRTRVVDPLCASTTYPLMGIPTGSLTAWQTHWERRPQNGHIALPPELPEWLVDAHLAAETTGSHFIADVLRANALSSAPATSSLAREWCRQLLSHGSWEPLEDIGGSAGIHVRALDGWEPESPAMRVRRALMARTDFATTALSASRQFEMRIDLPVETGYEFALWTPAVGCTPTEPVRIQWQVDGGPLREQTVGAEPLRIPLKWRPGRHTLRLWQADPPQRHYTLLRVGRESDWAEYRPDAESRAQRTYHVARASEPVRFRVEGPHGFESTSGAPKAPGRGIPPFAKPDGMKSNCRWLPTHRKPFIEYTPFGMRTAPSARYDRPERSPNFPCCKPGAGDRMRSEETVSSARSFRRSSRIRVTSRAGTPMHSTDTTRPGRWRSTGCAAEPSTKGPPVSPSRTNSLRPVWDIIATIHGCIGTPHMSEVFELANAAVPRTRGKAAIAGRSRAIVFLSHRDRRRPSPGSHGSPPPGECLPATP